MYNVLTKSKDVMIINSYRFKKEVEQILFTIDGDMSADLITNIGDVLEWVIEGVMYVQNNVPAHTYLNQGGKGVCSSTDNFQGVRSFRMENASLVGTLDFSVLTSLSAASQLLLGNNDFSEVVIPELDVQLANFRISNNSQLSHLDISKLLIFPVSVDLTNCTNLSNWTYNSFTSAPIQYPILTGCTKFEVDLDLSTAVLQTNNSINISRSGILSFKGMPSDLLVSVSADNADNMTLLDLSDVHGLNGVIRAEGCASLSVVLFTTTHNAGSVSNFLFNDNPNVLEYDLHNLTFNDIDVFRVSNNTSLTSLIMPNSSSFKRSVLANDCNLGYIDFTNNTSILSANSIAHRFDNNNMLTGEVNHILFDLAAHVASEASGGDFTGRTINISGSNSAPDTISGGFDGVQSVLDLQSKGITVITS